MLALLGRQACRGLLPQSHVTLPSHIIKAEVSFLQCLAEEMPSSIQDNPMFNILGYLLRYEVELRKIGILQRLCLRRTMSGETTIFDKILDGSIPATFIHEDDKCVAFSDVAPQVPIKIKYRGSSVKRLFRRLCIFWWFLERGSQWLRRLRMVMVSCWATWCWLPGRLPRSRGLKR